MTGTSLPLPFHAALSRAIQAATGSLNNGRWEHHEEPAAVAPHAPTATGTPARDHLAAVLTLGGALPGELSLSLSPADAEALLGPSPVAAATSVPAHPHSDAWQRLAHEIARHLCADLSSTLGPVSLLVAKPGSIPDASTSLGTVVLRSHDEITSVTISIAADTRLACRLEAATTNPQTSHPTAPERPATMDRVLDVQLAVTLRFGQRQLTLRELLALSAGSLLELDRQVEEPVDLMLGERIIARGEVVIVDGNYGLRITEVLEHANRLVARDRVQPLSYARA